jgi:hypothetical protein
MFVELVYDKRNVEGLSGAYPVQWKMRPPNAT